MKIKIFNREICVCALLATNSICAKSSAEMEKIMKIALMGGIKNLNQIKRIFQESVELSCFIDNHAQIAGSLIEGKKVYSPYDFPGDQVDYIILFIYGAQAVRQELIDLGITAGQIIDFHAPDLNFFAYRHIFLPEAADRLRLTLRSDDIDRRIRAMEESQRYFQRNFLYEAADRLKNKKLQIPKVNSVEDTLEKIISDRCCISRYGDGEFEIILGSAKDVYQSDNAQLAERLQEILTADLPNHIVAVADDYGAMEGLREENKNTIRRYMTEEKRKQHYALLDMEKEYYNAYISRPYVIYPYDETEKARKRFDDLKRIWDGKSVLFVEGDKTRMGVGNDLFDNAASLERILAPNENAFDVYDEICDAVIKHGKKKLILIALGPTATVLAYDLAKVGYWALDVGHLDLEYEWFLKGRGYSYIPHKYNNEMLGDTNVVSVDDNSYDNSVICKVGI